MTGKFFKNKVMFELTMHKVTQNDSFCNRLRGQVASHRHKYK